MKMKPRCKVCGVTLNEENTFEFNGDILCEHCLEERSVICDCCGTRISRERADGDEYTTLCNSCYVNRYTCCENCGVLISYDNAYCSDDDDYYYCSDCYEKLKNKPIKNYNYKPKTIFYEANEFVHFSNYTMYNLNIFSNLWQSRNIKVKVYSSHSAFFMK